MEEELNKKEKKFVGDFNSEFSVSRRLAKLEEELARGSGFATAGFSSRSIASGTGIQEIVVGFKPSMIKITAFDPGDTRMSFCSFNGNVTEDKVRLLYAGSADFTTGGQTVINLSSWGVADIHSIDSAGFTLNWTTVTRDISFIWEAYK